MIFVGTQWVTAKAGNRFKLDMIVTDNADDPNVRSAASSCLTTPEPFDVSGLA
jgi:hypothetical protein